MKGFVGTAGIFSFSPQDQDLYENKLKPTFQFFSEVLLEVFDQLGCPEEGWEESTKLMPDCPAKVVAMAEPMPPLAPVTSTTRS